MKSKRSIKEVITIWKNFKVIFIFDGCKFWDVVRAEDADTAKDYFVHDTTEGYNGSKIVNITETSLEPTYTAPLGYKYVPPVPVEITAEERTRWEAEEEAFLAEVFGA